MSQFEKQTFKHLRVDADAVLENVRFERCKFEGGRVALGKTRATLRNATLVDCRVMARLIMSVQFEDVVIDNCRAAQWCALTTASSNTSL